MGEIKKLLCKIGIHDWDYDYIFDRNVNWPRFHIKRAYRKCKRCPKKQQSCDEDGSNRIRYETW